MSVSTTSSGREAAPGVTTGRRIELWVRATEPQAEDVRHLVEQGTALEREGIVDGFDVRTWDSCVDLSSSLRSHREQLIRSRIQAFKRWAWEHGTDLPGFGSRRRAGRGRMGPEYIAQDLPPVLLAEYEQGVLTAVTPCSRSERCVAQRLNAIEAERREDQSSLHSRIIR